jgi:hypothetical protein
MIRRRTHRFALAVGLAAASIVPWQTASAAADPLPHEYVFTPPAFGLATAPDGSLLVADGGAGIVGLRKGVGSLLVDLPGVADVSPVGRSTMFAITSIGDPATEQPDSAWGAYLVMGGKATRVADLLDFEKANNPDGNLAPGGIDSNPFDIEALNGRSALVADAGANDLLVVDRDGGIDWVATLPQEVVSTANVKSLFGCPTPPPGAEFICDLPPAIPAQPVATSIAVGPDGGYYVGELKGFPGPADESRIWRIEAGSRHVRCGTDPGCTLVFDGGFTSIVDLVFGPDGTLYVTEIDEASFFAVEAELGFGIPDLMQGGTVDACDVESHACTELATDLKIPIATTVGKDGTVYALTEVLLPSAKVIALP